MRRASGTERARLAAFATHRWLDTCGQQGAGPLPATAGEDRLSQAGLAEAGGGVAPRLAPRRGVEIRASRLTPRTPRLSNTVYSDSTVSEAGPQIGSAAWFQVDYPAACILRLGLSRAGLSFLGLPAVTGPGWVGPLFPSAQFVCPDLADQRVLDVTSCDLYTSTLMKSVAWITAMYAAFFLPPAM